MFHKNMPRATAFEKLRMDAIRKGGCVLSMYRRERGLAAPERGAIEIHHVVRNNKRMGQMYTIPLNTYYNSGVVVLPARRKSEAVEIYGASLKDGMRVFRASHGVDDLDLWKLLQERMGMSTELPHSKVLPSVRRARHD